MHDWQYNVLYKLWWLLTTCSRILPQKLVGLQLVKKSPEIYRTRRFITESIKALCWGRPIRSTPPSHFLKIHFIVIFPSNPRSSKWSFSLRCPPASKSCMHLSCFPCVPHVHPVSLFLIWSPEWHLAGSTVREVPRYWNYYSIIDWKRSGRKRLWPAREVEKNHENLIQNNESTDQDLNPGTHRISPKSRFRNTTYFSSYISIHFSKKKKILIFIHALLPNFVYFYECEIQLHC